MNRELKNSPIFLNSLSFAFPALKDGRGGKDFKEKKRKEPNNLIFFFINCFYTYGTNHCKVA